MVDDLRRNMKVLIEENSIAKDEIYRLTIKLYHLEQENMAMKGDLQRRDKELPHQMSLIQDNYTRNIESFENKRSLEKVERKYVAEKDEVPIREVNQGRRREFARERGGKVDRAERTLEREENRERRAEPRGEPQQRRENPRERNPSH